MDVRCPKCGAINKIPDLLKPKVTFRCGKCSSKLVLKPRIESNHVPESRWLHAYPNLEKFLLRHGIQLLLAMFGILGTLLVVFVTYKYGAGISADAIAYVTCAKNLAAGAGYICDYNGQYGVIYVYWPPLFPTLLAGLDKVGIEPLQGARFLNAFVFGLIVFTSGQLFRMFIKSKTLVILATLLILFSFPIFSYSLMALTEPLFALLGILFAIYLLKFLKEQRFRFLFLTGLFAALSFLQRYMGVAFILAGCIVVISPLLKSPLLQRFKYAVVFGLVAIMPGAVWVIRNLILTSTPTGERVLSQGHTLAHTLYENIQHTLQVIGHWFLPFDLGLQTVNIELVLGVFAVFVFLTAVLASVRQRRKKGLNTNFTRAWPVAVIVLVYTFWLIAAETAVPSESILNPRFLLPIQAFAILLVFIGIENLLRVLTERWGAEHFLQYAAIGLCALWVLFSFLVTSDTATNAFRYGCGWNSDVVWESPLMEWLRANPLDGEVYSNAPGHVYFATGISAKYIIWLDSSTPSPVSSTSPENNKYLVLCEKILDEHYYNFEDLSSKLDLEEVARFSDGAIYVTKDH